MLLEYVQKALERAHYEIIDDPDPYYGEVPGLEGVWASGATLEACRQELTRAIEDWILFSISKGLPIPALDGVKIELPQSIEK
jgi:predicted RNase H-like HicB family nuclease